MKAGKKSFLVVVLKCALYGGAVFTLLFIGLEILYFKHGWH